MFKMGVAVAVAALVAPRTVPAQVLREIGRPPFEVGIGIAVAQPTGDFSNYVSVGGGLIGHGVWTPDRSGVFGLRFDVSGIIYGSTTRSYTLVPLITVDVTTTNSIVTAFFGPQFATGGDVRLYGFGELGFSYFATSSSVEGSGDIGPFAHTTNFDDFTFATTAGGGVKIQLTHTRHPLSLDLGARYLYNGRARYLRSSSITITGNTVQYTPIESQTNLILYQIGVSVGLGGR